MTEIPFDIFVVRPARARSYIGVIVQWRSNMLPRRSELQGLTKHTETNLCKKDRERMNH